MKRVILDTKFRFDEEKYERHGMNRLAKNKPIWDEKFIKNLKEASKIVNEHIKDAEKKLPEGWKMCTWMCPIQYEKIVKIGKKIYIGHIRSRQNRPFSVEIYEKGRKFKLKKLVFSHKNVDKAENNPPLKSVRIIEDQFRKMKKGKRDENSIKTKN